jgi:hypothetical protein
MRIVLGDPFDLLLDFLLLDILLQMMAVPLLRHNGGAAKSRNGEQKKVISKRSTRQCCITMCGS